MARIRTIKPEFPQSETTGALSRDARLLFIQLWTIADDQGRARAASRMLAGLLFPYDDDAPGLMEGWLAELEKAECIVRYVVEGSRYLQVVNWYKHQKIDRPSESKLPPFDDPSRVIASRHRALDADLGPSTLDLESDRCARGATDDEFSDFIKASPKKVSQDAARRKLDEVLASGVAFEDILAGMKRYAKAEQGNEPRFVDAPDRWLEKGRWKDGIVPGEPRAPPADGIFIRRDDPRWAHFAAQSMKRLGVDPKEVEGGAWFLKKWAPKEGVGFDDDLGLIAGAGKQRVSSLEQERVE